MQINNSLERTQITSTYERKPDTYAFAAIFVCVKLCYGLDDIKRIPKKENDPAHQIVDWELWASLVRRVWVEDEVFTHSHPLDVMNWDKSKIHRFLAWLERNYILKDEDILKTEKNLSHVNKFVHLFPRHSDDSVPDTIKHHQQGLSSDDSDGSDNDDANLMIEQKRSISQLLMKGFYAEKTNLKRLENPDLKKDDEYEEFKMGSNEELIRISNTTTGQSSYDTPDENILSENYPSTSAITEINQLLHSTTTSYDVQLSKHDSDDEWEDDIEEHGAQHKKIHLRNSKYKGIKLRPGERYPDQNLNHMSDYTKLLLEVGRKMLGEPAITISGIIAKLESKLVSINKK